MPMLVVDHHLKDFDAWFDLFSNNRPPDIGRWRVVRGVDDPNRVRVVAEVEPSEVDAIKQFVASAEMQSTFEKVNAMSTAPMDFVWFDEVKMG